MSSPSIAGRLSLTALELQRLAYKANTLEAENADLKAQLEKARKNASGNIVLVRRDGFSKPMHILAYGYSPHAELPPYISEYRLAEDCETSPFSRSFVQSVKDTYRLSGSADGFGRRLYVQV